MNLTKPLWLLLAAGLAVSARAAEANVWPFWVGGVDEKNPKLSAGQVAGPLYYYRDDGAGSRLETWRPFWLRTEEKGRATTRLLYPLFTWRQWGDETSFSFFQLWNDRTRETPGESRSRSFDVWPLYFSRDSGHPATSYQAFFPIEGTIKHRFGKDLLEWHLFPLYFHTVKDGMHTTTLAWPIVRIVEGAGHRGFEVWPLYGRRGRPGDYDRQFWLWPLVYRQAANLGEPIPTERVGALPFYTRDTGPGYRSETYLWPFFGYTDRTLPKPYHETRYLWPFLVQGRGEGKYVNRFGPVYTHSVIRGYDKTWVLWPLFRQARWADDGVAQRKTQLLYFLYWSLEQHSLANPAAAPAVKRHVWPLVSSWDNGAGRRQVQVLSPLEVFFPDNDPVRQLYTPLFALYRYEQSRPGEERWTLLWGAATSRRSAAGREFHLGPLYSAQRTPEGARVALGLGLLSWRREGTAGPWRFSLFDFPRSPAKPVTTPSSP